MKDPCNLYISQRNKAKAVLDILEKQRAEINFKLKSNDFCANLHKELRNLNMDIRITLNEIEHAEYNIQECISKNSPISN